MKKAKPWLICSAIWLLVIAAGIYYVYVTMDIRVNEPMVVVVKATRELNKGDIIKDKDIMISKVFRRDRVPNAATDLSVIGCKVVDKIAANEQILLDRIIPPSEFVDEGLREYAIRVDLDTTVANRVKIHDYVEIWVSYKDTTKADLVVAKAFVKDLRNNSGRSLNEDKASLPTYAVFDFDSETIRMLDDAQKYGKLFLVKIPADSKVVNEATYIPSWVGGRYRAQN